MDDYPELKKLGLTLIGFVILAAIVFLRWQCVKDASAEPDPCAKEKIAASRRNAPPSAINRLHDCRNQQRATKANPPPWLRDGGVSDQDEYVRVPCPPGLPKWRVCEKRRSEIQAARDGGK